MYSETLLKTLINLDNVTGVSGDEKAVAEMMKKEMEGLYDEYIEDPMGTQIFIRYGKDRDKKIVFSAHMDEIGFIINYIEPNGLARFLPVGYHDDRTAVNQDMYVVTDSGERILGVTGSKPAHIMTPEDHEKVIDIEELYLDFGTDSADETRALGVEIGCYAGFAREGYLMNGGKYYTGKSVDDRAGCAALVETLRRLKGQEVEPTIVMAGSVQEEVGMRSGAPLVNRLNPELFMAVDVALTGGTPGIDENKISTLMGLGPAVKYYDWDPILGATGSNVPRKLTNRIIEVAKAHNIPFQREVITGGGTDAWSAAMAGCGVLAGGISIPQRYMHTAVGTVNMEDLDYTVELIVNFIKEYKTI
ncbi:Putative aminopeptidase ysdC [uncultured Eubacterium sp.]|nr:Putative aminopeptidase ysdC [uncultured Eubacterium sp.]